MTSSAGANPYQERLEKLQQKFRGQSQVDEESTVISKARPVSVDSFSAKDELKSEPKMKQGTQSYEALKERLAQMKQKMIDPKE